MSNTEQLKALRDAAAKRIGRTDGSGRLKHGMMLYAAPVASIPLAQARRDALKEALALVERDRTAAAAHSQDPRDAAWNALNLAADGIRALAEKVGEGSK